LKRKKRWWDFECEWSAKIVARSEFEYIVALLVLANGILIGIQTDHEAKNIEDRSDLPFAFVFLDKCFAVCFLGELLLRLLTSKLKFFTDAKNWKWNWFDFLVVALQVVEELMSLYTLIVLRESLGSSSSYGQFNYLRVLRILRLTRIVRLVRLLRLIGELKTIVDSILGSMRSLFWTMLLLMLFIYMIGVYFTQEVADHRVAVMENEIRDEKDDELEYHFNSLIRTLLTLYASMTGGVDWESVAAPLIDRISPVMGVLYAMYIAFSVLAFMNVITGVFVESALHQAKSAQDHDLIHQARELFAKCDESGSGKLSIETIHSQLSNPEMEVYFKMLDVDISEAEGLFKLLDIDESGQVDYEEFLEGCMRLRGNARAIDVVTVMIEGRKLSRKWQAHARVVENDLNFVAGTVEQLEEVLHNLSSYRSEDNKAGVADAGAPVQNRRESQLGRHTAKKTTRSSNYLKSPTRSPAKDKSPEAKRATSPLTEGGCLPMGKSQSLK
jgi:hypothetical protein